MEKQSIFTRKIIIHDGILPYYWTDAEEVNGEQNCKHYWNDDGCKGLPVKKVDLCKGIPFGSDHGLNPIS